MCSDPAGSITGQSRFQESTLNPLGDMDDCAEWANMHYPNARFVNWSKDNQKSECRVCTEGFELQNAMTLDLNMIEQQGEWDLIEIDQKVPPFRPIANNM